LGRRGRPGHLPKRYIVSGGQAQNSTSQPSMITTKGITALQMNRKFSRKAAIATIKANPYQLADDIRGIGFKTADELAAKLGIDSNSPNRARAAVRYCLQELAQEGHCGYPAPGVVERTTKPVEIPTRKPKTVDCTVDSAISPRGARKTPRFSAAGWNAKCFLGVGTFLYGM